MTSRQQITVVPPRQASRPPVVYDHEILIPTEDGRQLAVPVQKVIEVHHHYQSEPIAHELSGLDYVELDKQDAAIWRMASRRHMEEIFYRKPKPASSETDFVSVVLGIVFLAFLGLCMVGIVHH